MRVLAQTAFDGGAGAEEGGGVGGAVEGCEEGGAVAAGEVELVRGGGEEVGVYHAGDFGAEGLCCDCVLLEGLRWWEG